MKTTEEIDALIKETLTQEEAKFYQELEEQSIWQMVWGLFDGKNRWIMYAMNIMTLVFFGLFVYCVWKFFQAEELKELLKWVGGAVIFMLGVSMLKVLAWLQMDKNAILREIKRLELQILSLSSKLSD